MLDGGEDYVRVFKRGIACTELNLILGLWWAAESDIPIRGSAEPVAGPVIKRTSPVSMPCAADKLPTTCAAVSSKTCPPASLTAIP